MKTGFDVPVFWIYLQLSNISLFFETFYRWSDCQTVSVYGYTVQSARLCVLVYLATLMLWRTMTRPTSSTNMTTVTPTTATTSPATAAQPAPAAGSTAAR